MVTIGTYMADPVSIDLSKEQSLVLKCIAICAMLCHHLFTCVPDGVVVSYGWLTIQIGEIGKVCVALFLFVSGYGLYKQYNSLIYKISPPPIDTSQNADNEEVIYSVNRWIRFVVLLKETIKFELKRFIKFYTNYLVIFLIFVPIGVFVFHRSLVDVYGTDNIIQSLFVDLLGCNGFESYNITWWFNKVIIYLYLLFPLLFWSVKKFGVLMLALSWLWMKYKFGVLDYISDWTFPFVMGMCCVRYSGFIEKIVNKIGVPLSLVGAILFTVAWIIERQTSVVPYLGCLRADGFICFGLYLIIVLCPMSEKIKNAMGFIGSHSANIYMIHTFIYGYWFTQYVYVTDSAVVSFVILLAVCLGLSWCLEFFKDKSGIYKLSDKCIHHINKIGFLNS